MTTGAQAAQPPLDWWLEMPPSDDELVFDDGEPMDSMEHRATMVQLVEVLKHHFRERDDVYVGANEALYFSALHARNRDFRAPDLFVVMDCQDGRAVRRGWVVWNENGQVPTVIVELLSPTTEAADRGIKLDTYRRLGVQEYFLYDLASGSLEGFDLSRSNGLNVYSRIMPDAVTGRLQVRALGLELGEWHGTYENLERSWLRLFLPSGALVPTPAEAERQRAEAERQRAEAERRRADELVAKLAAYQARFGQLDEP